MYPTADGFVYLAIGNDVQWARLTSVDAFVGIASPTRNTNAGRRQDRESIHEDIGGITPRFQTAELVKLLSVKGLVAAPINTIPQVVDYPPIRNTLLETKTPSGKRVHLPPPSVECEHLTSRNRHLPYAPTYGQDTDRVFEQAGFSQKEITGLRGAGIVA